MSMVRRILVLLFVGLVGLTVYLSGYHQPAYAQDDSQQQLYLPQMATSASSQEDATVEEIDVTEPDEGEVTIAWHGQTTPTKSCVGWNVDVNTWWNGHKGYITQSSNLEGSWSPGQQYVYWSVKITWYQDDNPNKPVVDTWYSSGKIYRPSDCPKCQGVTIDGETLTVNASNASWFQLYNLDTNQIAALPQQSNEFATPAQGNYRAEVSDSEDGPWVSKSACEFKVIEAKALGDYQCDDSEWHFVINGLQSADDAPPKIWVEFDESIVIEVLLEKVTGSTAHYRTTEHLDKKVIKAWTSIEGDFNNFNVSHGPCQPASCQSVSAEINADTMEVTGTATSLNAEAWQVIRKSDSNVMDSGTGGTADFSYTGEYATGYQTQFQGRDGKWSNEGCIFSFPPPEEQFNLESLCRPSKEEARFRISNESDVEVSWKLEKVGSDEEYSGVVSANSEIFQNTSWSSTNDMWKLTITGNGFEYEYTQTVGENALCAELLVDISCEGLNVSGKTDALVDIAWSFNTENSTESNVPAGPFNFVFGTPVNTYGVYDLSGSASFVLYGKEYADNVTLNDQTCGTPPTETPKPTETPVETETPEPTETPVETETPKPTETPVVTETPKPTETPVVTETPEPTETPVVTETPEVTPKPTDTPPTAETPTPMPTDPAKLFGPFVISPGCRVVEFKEGTWTEWKFDKDSGMEIRTRLDMYLDANRIWIICDEVPVLEDREADWLICHVFGDPYIFCEVREDTTPQWEAHPSHLADGVLHPIWGEGWHAINGAEVLVQEVTKDDNTAEIVVDVRPSEDGARTADGGYVFIRHEVTWGENALHVMTWTPIIDGQIPATPLPEGMSAASSNLAQPFISALSAELNK